MLFAVAVATRLVTTIHYLEDTDSLRFALATQEYSLAKLQPHFPGYPVFCALAKALYLATGSFATAFSLIGGIATFGIAFFLLRIARVPLHSPAGVLLALLVLFNPLLWLMGNRYMPDLLGVAVLLSSFALLTDGVPGAAVREGRHGDGEGRTDGDGSRRVGGGGAGELSGLFLAGVLAGVRLSYLPFLLPPVVWALVRSGRPLRGVAAGTAGVAVWLLPLLAVTGWDELIGAARRQTEGHFNEFGGTVRTEPLLLERVLGLARGVWADGLGAYWTGRHPLTLLVGVGVVVALLLGLRAARGRLPTALLGAMAAGWGTYLLWILLYQNVIHKSRHVLPLLPFLLLLLALGGAARTNGTRARGYLLKGVILAALLAYCGVATVLATQHRRPTAIAQAAEYLRGRGAEEELTVVSIPLVNFYLDAHGVRARFVDVEEGTAPGALPTGGVAVAIGDFRAALGEPDRSREFFHNPYVNRMWPEVEVSEYDRR